MQMKWMEPLDANSAKVPERGHEEFGEFGVAHFAGGHGEFAVFDLSEPGDVARDRDVVRRVGKY